MSFGVGLFVLTLSIFFQTQGQTVLAFSREVPAVTTHTIAKAGLGSSYEVPGRPVRLIIPSIGVDAKIQSVGLSWRGNGDMGVPTNFTDVGWYKDGSLPGAPGSAVIDGHLDGKKVARAVFYDLGKLQPGDLVEVVDANGKTLQFRVVRTAVYDAEAPAAEIFSTDTSKIGLNLITCTGDWLKAEKQYNKRIVVFTELVTN